MCTCTFCTAHASVSQLPEGSKGDVRCVKADHSSAVFLNELPLSRKSRSLTHILLFTVSIPHSSASLIRRETSQLLSKPSPSRGETVSVSILPPLGVGLERRSEPEPTQTWLNHVEMRQMNLAFTQTLYNHIITACFISHFIVLESTC